MTNGVEVSLPEHQSSWPLELNEFLEQNCLKLVSGNLKSTGLPGPSWSLDPRLDSDPPPHPNLHK